MNDKEIIERLKHLQKFIPKSNDPEDECYKDRLALSIAITMVDNVKSLTDILKTEA